MKKSFDQILKKPLVVPHLCNAFQYGTPENWLEIIRDRAKQDWREQSDTGYMPLTPVPSQLLMHLVDLIQK